MQKLSLVSEKAEPCPHFPGPGSTRRECQQPLLTDFKGFICWENFGGYLHFRIFYWKSSGRTLSTATVIMYGSDSNTTDDEPAKPLLHLNFLFVYTWHQTMFSFAALGTFTAQHLLLEADRLRQGTCMILWWYKEERRKNTAGFPWKSRKNVLSRRLIKRIYSFCHAEFVCL